METHVGAIVLIRSGVAVMMTMTSRRSQCVVYAAGAVSLAQSSRHLQLDCPLHLARQHLVASVRVNGHWLERNHAQKVAAIPTMILEASGVLWWTQAARVRIGDIALTPMPALALRRAHRNALTPMPALQTKMAMFAGSTASSRSGALVMMIMTSRPP